MPERFPVRLHPRAEAEARAAYRWYAERNELVAEAFANLDKRQAVSCTFSCGRVR